MTILKKLTDFERGYEQGKADALEAFDQVEKVMTAFWNLQRQWVELTDEEIKEIIGPWGDTPIKGYTRKLFDQIEAKLRSKNT
jgi:hypothetical protein